MTMPRREWCKLSRRSSLRATCARNFSFFRPDGDRRRWDIYEQVRTHLFPPPECPSSWQQPTPRGNAITIRCQIWIVNGAASGLRCEEGEDSDRIGHQRAWRSIKSTVGRQRSWGSLAAMRYKSRHVSQAGAMYLALYNNNREYIQPLRHLTTLLISIYFTNHVNLFFLCF